MAVPASCVSASGIGTSIVASTRAVSRPQISEALQVRNPSREHSHAEPPSGPVQRTAPRIDVPVYFVSGRNDALTPPELIERYVEKLQAPRKRIIWFEHAGHLPPYEEPERFVSAMVDEVLRETAPREGISMNQS